MANVKLLFYGTEKTDSGNMNLQCFNNKASELSICTNDNDTCNELIISFDKETAIRFSRELRKQISLMD